MADKEISTKPNAIILNKNDNIIVALRNMNEGD